MPFAVSGEQFPGSIQMRVLANTGENIEDLSPVRPGVVHTVRSQDRQSIMRGKIDKLLINAFLSANEVALKFNKNILTSECLDQKLRAIREILGSAPCQRATSGSLPDGIGVVTHKARRCLRQAAASYRLTACAPRPKKRDQSLGELRQLIPLNRALPFFAAQMRLGQ